MKITVTAKPRARRNAVEEIDAAHFVVHVTEPPTDGRANRAILRLLATHLGVPPSSLKILRGLTGRSKVVEVMPPLRGISTAFSLLVLLFLSACAPPHRIGRHCLRQPVNPPLCSHFRKRLRTPPHRRLPCPASNSAGDRMRS